jgi:hypothetical protein
MYLGRERWHPPVAPAPNRFGVPLPREAAGISAATRALGLSYGRILMADVSSVSFIAPEPTASQAVLTSCWTESGTL